MKKQMSCSKEGCNTSWRSKIENPICPKCHTPVKKAKEASKQNGNDSKSNKV